MQKKKVNKRRGPKPQHHPAYIRLRELLGKWREERGITQRALAERMHKPQSFVAKVETGSRRIDPVEWLMFLDALGMDVAEAVKALRR